MSNGFLSKRVKRRDQSGITSDRYEFLGLDQAEPDLGDPIVGPSSIGVNPYTGSASDLYVLVSDSSGAGNRYWTQQANIISGGVVSPGSITVRDEGAIIGSVNQVTDINFVGSGVTVISPASWVGAGASSVDIQITVTDVSIPSGQTGSIAYRDGSGLLQGATNIVYNSSNQRVGVGTALPSEKLEVAGNLKVTGDITAQDISASSFIVSNFIINDETLTFSVTSEAVGIGTSIPIATLDVRGTTNISGVATVTRVDTPQLRATNVNVTGVTTTGSLNIGSNEVISGARQLRNIVSLDAVTTATIESAIAAAPNTFNDLNVTGIATALQLDINGIADIQNLNVTGVSSVGILTATNLKIEGNSVVTGISTVGSASTGVTLNSNGNINATGTLTVGFSTSNNSWVSGTSTITTIDTDTLYVERVEATSIGVGTTNPQSELDVVGDIRFTGAIYASNGPGSSGQVLLSNGTNPVAWGNPSEVTTGSATSVTVTNTNTNGYYYPTFVSGTTGNQGINLDSSGLVYNPSTNNLGIGSTMPKVTLDVVGNANITGIVTVGNINVQGLTRLNSGIVTSYNRNTVVIDTVDTNLFRSARYNIQVTTYGRLIPGSQSVTTLEGGTNYSPGTYEDVSLISSGSGVGTDAKATIVISPEATLGITSSYEGLFFTSGSTSGIETGQTLYFNKTVFVSDRDDSIITGLTLNSGVGYTVFPSATLDSPIIGGNPVQGVGIGSTAEVRIDSLKVTNVVLNSGNGLVTANIPTVSFASPVGVGTSATGLVGFGLSTITVTSSGSGYYSVPSVTIAGGAAAQVSGIFVSNINISNIGIGYTPTDFPVAITAGPPAVGVNTATLVQTSFSIPNDFNITAAGAGYTAIPTLTVASPSIGVNTATVTCTLGISTFTVGAAGSGYVTSPSLTLSQTPTGFSGRVGLGISNYLVQFNGGSGYTTIPTISFNPVNGIGTGAAAFVSRDPGTNTLFGFTITNPGYGYTTPPLVVFNGGGGSGAGATIRTMIVSNVDVFEDGYGLSSVPTANISTPTTQFSDLVVSYQGTVGIATTTRLSSIVISNQGTLSIASTTIISGISTFNTVQYVKTGDLDQPTDFSITGITTTNIRVGQGVTGTNVSAGTTVVGVLASQVLISQGTTNSVPVISNTFYFNDTQIQSVQVGQGVTGTFISAGSTVVSVGSSQVTLSLAAFNSGSHTNTYYFGPIETVPGIGATTIITGITTTSILVGQGVTGSNVQSSTLVSSIGSNVVTISNSTTNIGITTQQFYFNTLTNVTGTGASVTPSLGIGSVTVIGVGTGYLTLPGIAVTANDGITGNGGIVTTRSFGISSNCVSIANSGRGYTNSIPSVLFNPPGGSGTAAVATLGVGISAISVTTQSSGYTTKPAITFSGGSGGTGLAATVTNIIVSGVSIVNAGYGYTASDLPSIPTFSNVGIAGSTGFGIYSVTLTKPGLGYTVTPSVSISANATLGSASNATITPTLGYNSSFDLSPGPGYGGIQVYYIQPQSANTFKISTNANGTGPIVLGYSTSNSPSAIVGGEVTSVTITEPGSGYVTGDVIEFENGNFDIAYDTNVGVGFSFIVGNTYGDFQVSDILMLQTVGSATSEVHIIEYAGVSNQESLGEYSTDISGTNARLKFTSTHANNTIKLSKTSITN